jgi:hypothetical protein
VKKFEILLFASIWMIALYACQSFRDTSNDVSQLDLSKLLISDEKDLPEAEWETNGLDHTVYDTRRSPDVVSIIFLSGDEPDMFGVSQEVFRYTSEFYSKDDYQYAKGILDGYFPPGWTYKSTMADESHFSCFQYRNAQFPQCFWIARYGKIVINIRAWLNPEKMSLETMQTVVQKVDSLASEYLITK